MLFLKQRFDKFMLMHILILNHASYQLLLVQYVNELIEGHRDVEFSGIRIL
jgi:hypothetical protein